MKRQIMAGLLFLLAGGIASAQQTAGIPSVISYQGIVTSSDGTPIIDGEYPITVTIYSDERGGASVWQDTYMTSVRGGIFSIYLGSGKNPLPAPSQMDKSLWIGTQIAGGEELRPLTRLSSAPYALNVPDNAITTQKLADGAVTADKVNLDYISGVSVNGRKIDVKGTLLNIQAGKDIDLSYDEATQSLVIGKAAVPAGKGHSDDKDNGRELLGGPADSWAMEGNGVDQFGNPVAPDANDFIGSRAGFVVPFTVRVNGDRIMHYQLNTSTPGVTPSIIGGHGDNTSVITGTGNTIGGGGGSAVSGLAHTIDGFQYNVISGGVDNHILNSQSMMGVVGGGQDNEIGSASSWVHYGVIGGGLENRVLATYGFIGGGKGSIVSAVHGTVGGGIGNIVSGALGTIAGGDGNQLSRGDASIGGGYHNQINGTGDYATLAGGSNNTISGQYSSIGGGFTNQVVGKWGVIGGGYTNNILHADATGNVVAGGQSNTIGTASTVTNYAVIAGGLENSVTATYGFVGGGKGSVVSAVHGTVGGGIGNIVSGALGTIAGGDGNQIAAPDGSIGGGYHNQIATGSDYATIAGGSTNVINGRYHVIGGGLTNNILNTGSFGGTIAGGQSNTIGGAAGVANYGVIAGGLENRVLATYGFIGGGKGSIVSAVHGTVGGGIGNIVSGPLGTIAGGDGNQLSLVNSSIGGGYHNQIINSGVSAAIPGGENLTAQSYGQTVMGVMNIPKGNVSPGGSPNNEPILIVGNGIQGFQSNAFEVSYNGHSTVFHNTGGATPVILGSTYVDNVTYAWGTMDQDGNPICEPFGVTSVDHIDKGWYQIKMDIIDPNGNPVEINCGSVTATIASQNGPGGGWFSNAIISVSQIVNNVFDVYVLDTSGNPVDEGFMFKVTGRP